MVNLLGAALPTNLLQLDPAVPTETNELGFWEGFEINTLNNEFLASIGSSWDDTARIPEAVFRSDAALSMRDRIVRHLEAEFADAPLFAIKDPRIARLTPLWIEALKAFGAEPDFILAFRNPLEVAQSLLKRDQMGRGQATLLWLRYMLEAERNTRNFRRSFVQYEALLEDWRGVARRVAEECGFIWPQFNVAAELAIDGFVSADRRHNVASAGQWAELPQWPRDVYDIFQQSARGDCLNVAVADRVSAELDRAGDVFDHYICELDFKARTQSSEVENLKHALIKRHDNVESLVAERNQLNMQVAQLKGELEVASTVAQRQLLASAQDRIKLEQRLSQAEGAARAAIVLRKRLDEANDQIDFTHHELEQKERSLTNTNASLAAAKLTLSNTIQKLQLKTSDAECLFADLTEARLELARMKEGLRERDDLRTQIDAMLASRTWRLTAPIRHLIGKAKITFARGIHERQE